MNDLILEKGDSADLVVHTLRGIAKAKNLPQSDDMSDENNPALAVFFK